MQGSLADTIDRDNFSTYFIIRLICLGKRFAVGGGGGTAISVVHYCSTAVDILMRASSARWHEANMTKQQQQQHFASSCLIVAGGILGALLCASAGTNLATRKWIKFPRLFKREGSPFWIFKQRKMGREIIIKSYYAPCLFFSDSSFPEGADLGARNGWWII